LVFALVCLTGAVVVCSTKNQHGIAPDTQALSLTTNKQINLSMTSATAKPFQQALYTANFYRDMERRVYREGVTVHVGKWLKKLEQLTYGQWVAYDAALSGGTAGGSAADSTAGSGGGGVELGGSGGSGGGGGSDEPPRAAFVTALVRNVYGGDVTMRPRAELLAKYLDRCAAVCWCLCCLGAGGEVRLRTAHVLHTTTTLTRGALTPHTPTPRNTTTTNAARPRAWR
jgi:hypothetical protein